MNLRVAANRLPAIAARPPLSIGLVAVLLCVVATPFGTAALPVAERALFWALLIGVNIAKWQLWYRHVAGRAGPGWQAAVLMVVAGAILLNATLPLELGLAFRLVGMAVTVAWAPTFVSAMAVSLAIGAGIAVALRRAPDVPTGGQASLPAAVPAPGSLAARAGLPDLRQVRVVVAEDHYLRLRLADGRTSLVLYRFGDALRELAALDGEQVHRSTWVAAAAVTGAVRDGRRWRLVLADGTTTPVSASFVAAARARGWLARPRDTA
ncbi:LytTR family transcriptional regulator DNA-binding domain-containing protein [Sandarakinorhabdus sp. DWP1-3-1]|uniref:LytTR family transcriptional regulator DNA-binding domain-containing protein n=1 Tax=Sandarakinorhabdus sp. DWP1-3-1 TaxID=2804627 RepID=UPI003CE9E9B5